MTVFSRPAQRLYRLLCLLLSCVLLNACGGDALQLANGIGGTGITAIGRLTAFGSVYVNGVHYNTDTAQFQYNGESAQQSDLDLGNIIRVKGTINADKKTGIAELVTYADTITGPVTQPLSGNTIEIMKQTVVIDDLTLFYGFKEPADLQTNNIVEVSGFSAANGKIKASSIRLKNESYIDGTALELEGFISDIDADLQTFNIDGLTVNYSQSQFTGVTTDTLKDDLYLIVTTNENLQNDTLKASKITLDDQLLQVAGLYEIEGFVTAFTSADAFSVDDSPIVTTSQTVINPTQSALQQDAYVRITGTSNAAGELVADEVTVIDSESEIVVESTLQAIDLSEKKVELLGQTARIDAFTLLLNEQATDTTMLSLNDFAVGDSVVAVIRKGSDGELTIVRLSKVDTQIQTFILGVPSVIDTALSTLTLFNQTIQTDNAIFYNSN
ncbi:MAG: DUF5666 domain-containing protein, partial [Leucothrix sp.]